METFVIIAFPILGVVLLASLCAVVYFDIKQSRCEKKIRDLIRDTFNEIQEGDVYTLKPNNIEVIVSQKIVSSGIPFILYEYHDTCIRHKIMTAKEFIFSVKQFEYEV